MSVTSLTWRLLRRGVAAWGSLIVVVLGVGGAAFRAAYPTAVERARFAATISRSTGLDALYGRPVRVEGVSGFVIWRYGGTITTVAALWALLAATRVLRGDEEAGRIEAIAARPMTPARLLALQLSVLAGSVVLLGLATAVGALVGGVAGGPATRFGLGVASAAALFGAVGALAAQCFLSRRRAAGVAGAVLGASYLLRALGDGSTTAGAAGWLSPLGWVERLSPAGGSPSAAAAAALLATTTLSTAAAVWARNRRDLGDALIADRPSPTRRRPVRSLLRLDLLLRR